MSVFNDARFLKTSVQSILNQSHKEFEFLIIDDGSTDNTEDIIRTFRDSRITYKKLDHSGLASALNYGLENSNEEWIARIDADDLNSPMRLNTQIDFLKKNSGFDVTSSWSVYFEDPYRILFLVKTPTEDKDIKNYLNLHNPINHSSVIFNKKTILEEGGYNESFKCYEDFELWFRLKKKLKFKIIPEYLVYTRLHKKSLTNRESKNDIYKLLLNNAKTNFQNTASKESKIYWNNLLFWIEYFYGDKSRARNYLTNNFSFKQAVAFLNTYLPEKAFDKILGMRLRYRLKSRLEDKSKFKSELEKLLSDS